MLKGWPAEIPQYPGSTITLAQNTSSNGKINLNVFLESSDPQNVTTDYYDRLVRQRGYDVFYLKKANGYARGVYVKGNLEFNLMTGTKSGGSSIVLNVRSPAEPVQTHVTGSLPASFPLQELTPYPGASIQTAASREGESVLIMEAKDSVDTIAGYYTSFYESHNFDASGSSLEELSASSKGTTIEFDREDVTIILQIGESQNGNSLVMLSEVRKQES